MSTELSNGVIIPEEYSDDWYDEMSINLRKLNDVIGSDSEKLSSADVGAAALSNNYNDLDNLPTIPTVNDATLTIQKNGVDVQTFTANSSSNVTCNITVPTKTSDLTNDSNFVDTSNPAVSSGITSAKVTSYDNHIADTDIHVTTADKNRWNTVTSKADDSDVVHKSGNETISGDKVFNNRLIKNIDVVLGTAPSIGKYSNIEIADNNKASLLQILGGVYDNGISYARFFVQNKTSDNGTGLSPTGTIRSCGFNINLPASSTSEGQGSITPRGNKTTDFGLLSYQWRNLWCEKLFLNGTQLDPSAFVTTDTAQTITGVKTFSEIVTAKVNGLTPSSLSLPSTTGVVDISSYITDLTGTANTYTVLVNGYIQFDVTGSSVEIDVTNGLSQKWIMTDPKGFIPVVSGASVSIKVVGTAINNFKFIPCQGNI